MQMPRSGPGGELLFIILLARGAHTGFLHFSLQLWSPVTASTHQTRGRDTVPVLVLKVRNCGVV